MYQSVSMYHSIAMYAITAPRSFEEFAIERGVPPEPRLGRIRTLIELGSLFDRVINIRITGISKISA